MCSKHTFAILFRFKEKYDLPIKFYTCTRKSKRNRNIEISYAHCFYNDRWRLKVQPLSAVGNNSNPVDLII